MYRESRHEVVWSLWLLQTLQLQVLLKPISQKLDILTKLCVHIRIPFSTRILALLVFLAETVVGQPMLTAEADEILEVLLSSSIKRLDLWYLSTKIPSSIPTQVVWIVITQKRLNWKVVKMKIFTYVPLVFPNQVQNESCSLTSFHSHTNTSSINALLQAFFISFISDAILHQLKRMNSKTKSFQISGKNSD